jgi:hypothetical protein
MKTDRRGTTAFGCSLERMECGACAPGDGKRPAPLNPESRSAIYGPKKACRSEFKYQRCTLQTLDMNGTTDDNKYHGGRRFTKVKNTSIVNVNRSLRVANIEVMSWVGKLPEVGDPILKRREAIKDKLLEAAALELQAVAIRGQAYQEALELSSRVGGLYSEAEIQKAQRQS